MKRTYGALILAGGKGNRMGGQNKALLLLERQTFLARLERTLAGFDEKLISLRDPSWLGATSFIPVVDEHTDRGPLEGLRCALSACKSDALLVVACDVPLFSEALAQALIQAGEGYDAIICRDSMGKLHPLCGIYSKRCLPAIEALVARGHYKLLHILSMVPSTTFSMDASGFSDVLLSNVNTPEALAALKKDRYSL